MGRCTGIIVFRLLRLLLRQPRTLHNGVGLDNFVRVVNTSLITTLVGDNKEGLALFVEFWKKMYEEHELDGVVVKMSVHLCAFQKIEYSTLHAWV